jgi:hypothetical protein
MTRADRQALRGRKGFLKGLPHSAWVRAISNRMYLTTRNSINVPICFESSRGTAEKKALINSGATENFIDWRLAKALKVQTMLLPQPQKVYNVDGMENKAGVIEWHVTLRVRQGDKERVQTFFITNLGDPHIIFGYPWLLRLAGLAIIRAYIWQYCAYVIRVHWMHRAGTPCRSG